MPAVRTHFQARPSPPANAEIVSPGLIASAIGSASATHLVPPSQPMLAKGFFAALAFVILVLLGAYSAWAEVGPFAWAAALQLAFFESYVPKLTWGLGCLFFILPGTLLVRTIKASGRATQAFAYGIPALLVLAHLAATIYFLSTGPTPTAHDTFVRAVGSANFLPQQFTLDSDKLPRLDAAHAAREKSGRSSENSGDLYIPFPATTWPDPKTPVVLKVDKLGTYLTEPKFAGTIRKAPVPYLVRRSWPEHPSDFAIVISHNDTIRFYWLLPAIIYGIGLIYLSQFLFKSRRSKAT